MNPSNQSSLGAPSLRIETEGGDVPFTVELTTPSPSRSAGARIPLLPALHIPSPILGEKSPASPSHLVSSVSTHNASKALNESRKLLAHLLGQLQRRSLPPPVFDAFKDGGNLNDTRLGEVVQTVRAVVKFKRGKRQQSTQQKDDSDEEDETETTFTTDATFSLMTQLKDVLLISRLQNWQIFRDSNTSTGGIEDRHESGARSPFRLRRNTLHVGGRRSPSPSRRSGSIQVPELLSQCISVLASVVSEDCRFKISSPRPSRPPNALQAVVLDVAQFLIHTQRHDPKVISEIAFALIPAFSTFHVEMQPRLFAFFEGIIRGVLEDLSRAQGIGSLESATRENFPKIDIAKSAMVSIQVEGPKDDTDRSSHITPWTPWSSLAPSDSVKLESTKAPLQPLPVYYLASLIPPLLVAILESINLASPSPPTVHRLCRLINAIASSKPDAHLDVLEVVAYHTAKARRSALCLLSTFWPSALGHVLISKPLPTFSYVDSLLRTGGTGPLLRRRADHQYAHQFIPWRFPAASKPTVFEGSLQQVCQVCSAVVYDFGLLCPFCMCAVHFDCYDYPEGSFLSQYALASDPNTQKVAVHRFCHVLSPRRDWDPRVVKNEGHAFKAVNIFALCLCFICRKPLWGCIMQGLKCSSCQQFVHSSCLSVASSADLPRCGSTRIDSSHVTIDADSVRVSFLDHYRDILGMKNLNLRTYEELSVIYAVVWTQSELLKNGVALGCVVIKEKILANPDPDKWELHDMLESLERLLTSGKLSVSVAMDEYLQESHRNATDHAMFFDWSNLVYISTILKSSFEEAKPIFASRDLLNVNPPQVPTDDTSDTPRHHYELVSLSHMRDALGYELHLFSDVAAGHLLTHLHHLGFFVRQDLDPVLFKGNFSNEDIACVFPIPQGLDLSTDVETLFAAIEGCLSDLDLSVNEQGFLLLIRRLWPNGMASEYAFRRLTRNLMSWIFAEDANLAAILRDYLAQGRQLPGVRTGHESLPWPSSNSTRPIPVGTVNNGGDYVASRRALLNQYVSRWLLAFHDQDVSVYAKVLYEICTELAEDTSVYDDVFLGACEASTAKKRNVTFTDRVLRYIIKLCQTNVTFSVFNDLFLMWLETVSAKNLYREPMPSLYRLFNREAEASNRSSNLIDATLGPVDAIGVAVVDSWRLVMQVASTDKDNWSRSLQWLCLFARSGVDIPIRTYLAFSSLATKFEASLLECILLVEAALSSAWLKSMGRQELQSMFSVLHSRLAPQVLECLRSRMHFSEALCFIRQSLATCLLLYGCERSSLLEIQMVTEDEIKDLPSRRKLNTRVSMASDPIIIDLGLMNALERYVEANVEDVTCFIAKFLNKFVTDSSLLEPYEVDNFILRNGRVLCACAWEFYDIQRHELSSVRSSFLLRTLVVDSQPFQNLMEDIFQPSGNWERRFVAVVRLFRMILDVTSPFFQVEDRQWRSCVIEVFYRYFGALWMDEKEEIRLAVDSCSQSLLPAHFEAITLCWNESLANAPIPERVNLLSFLVQLHPHFPRWNVLSWDAIIETLLEDDYLQKHGGNDDGAAAAHLSMYGLSSKDDEALQTLADPAMAALRVSIILLSLQMIEDGVNIDIFSLLKVKFHLAQVVGFNDVSVVPASSGYAFHVRLGNLIDIPEQSIPCVNRLPTVLDAHHPFDLAPAAVGGPNVEDDTPFPLLVGAIFVDLSLDLFSHTTDLLSLPIITLKSMLESLMIVIYKHDLDVKPLKHLHASLMKAVRRAMDLVSKDISYEIRQLALSVVQAYVKRWPTLRGAFVLNAVETVVKLISSLDHDGEDALVAQARSFLETSFTLFAAKGIFGILFKKPLDRDFFIVLKHLTDINANSMASSDFRDVILREAISNIADNESKVCQTMLNNINTYIEVAHHQGYSVDLVQAVNIALINVARRWTDWPTSFDPAPMLFISSTILQYNKAHSRELLPSVETILRMALTRFNITTECLSRILRVTSTLFRKTQPQIGPTAGQPQPSTQPNTIALAVFEIIANGLRRKEVVPPSTIASTIEALMSEDTEHTSLARTFSDPFLSLAEDGFFFLQNHMWSEVQSERDFAASVAVAKMILQVAEQKPDIILKQLADSSDRSSRPNLTVRTWNILAFAALSSSSNSWTSVLFAHFSTFSFTYNVSLRSFANSGLSPPETAQADINYAYNAIKLWILLALKNFRLQGVSIKKEKDPVVLEDNEDAATRMVWNELWPSFAMLVDFFQPQPRTPLAALTWSSVADLFLFLRQSRSDIAHDGSSHFALLVRLQKWCAGDAATSSRLARALRSLSEPLVDVPMDVVLNQIGRSIVAEEKLVVLETKSREPSIGWIVQELTR